VLTLPVEVAADVRPERARPVHASGGPARHDRGHRGAIVTVGSHSLCRAGPSVLLRFGAILQITCTVAVDHARDGSHQLRDHGRDRHAVFPAPSDTASDLTDCQGPRGAPAARPAAHAGEIAATIVFLASDDASGITGAAIPVDAGITTSFDFRTGDEGA
jgi:hypothetical protein